MSEYRFSPSATDPIEYVILVDDVTSSGIIYVGRAVPGTLSSQPLWQIKKIDTTGSPVTAAITYAGGNNSFTNIWNNRTGLSYG
jgi:hypothetical protein